MIPAFLVISLIYLHFLLEWVFYITKPSFLAGLNLQESLSILITTPLAVTVPALAVLGVLAIVARIFHSRIPLLLIPAAVLTTILFILIDNFTHTLFGFYAGSWDGYQRGGYILLLLALLIYAYRELAGFSDLQQVHNHRGRLLLASLLLPLISTSFIAVKILATPKDFTVTNAAQLAKMPNLLILSTDGLNAAHMSTYGYSRETTPTIDQLAAESLVALNSFTNGANTTGSVGALLSGKLPTRTGVIYPPSIFQGVHTYQHFAGILKQAGYRSIDLSVPFTADSYDLNMRDAFDIANQRDLSEQADSNVPDHLKRAFVLDIFFFGQVIDRVLDRFKHIMGIQAIIDPFELVTSRKAPKITDEQRLAQFVEFFKASDQPFFAHIHFMGTHGPTFRSKRRTFSRDIEQTESWMDDFYDDMIFDYDILVRRITHYLRRKGRYDNTLIVITSDHGTGWRTHLRVPLLIKFPDNEHSGVIVKNTQRADIPPTILDYLGLEIPDWMDGTSLIEPELAEDRLIFAAINARNEVNNGRHAVKDYGPPYYALGKLSLIQCNSWWQFDLIDSALSSGETDSQDHPCKSGSSLSESDVIRLIQEHLDKMGYDNSGLRTLSAGTPSG